MNPIYSSNDSNIKLGRAVTFIKYLASVVSFWNKTTFTV